MKPYPAVLLYLCCVFLWSKQVAAQPGNPCAVVATLSPAVPDTVAEVGTNIMLTGSSTNATSLYWLQEGFPSGVTGPSWNFNITPGVTTISLVATNGACSDTVTIVIFAPGKPYNNDTMMVANYGFYQTNEEPVAVRPTVDGGVIMAGIQYLWQECGVAGILVKTTKLGCIEWSKKILASTFCNNSNISNLHASADSTYYVVTNELDLMKLDKQGNLLWYKRYNVASGAIGIQHITGDEQGNVYFVSYAPNGNSLTKITSDGTIIWNKLYRFSDPVNGLNYPFVTNILYNNNTLYICGTTSNLTTSPYISFLSKVNTANGQRIWDYGYEDPEYPGALGFVHLSMYDTLIMASSGGSAHLITLIDPQGNNRKSFRTRFGSSYAPQKTRAFADNKGRIYLMQWTRETLPLQPYFSYSTNFAEIDSSLNKYWGLVNETFSRSYYTDACMDNQNKLAALGQEFSFVDNAAFGSRDMRLMKIDSLRENLSCFIPETFTITNNIINKTPLTYIPDSSYSLTSEPFVPHSTVDAFVQSRYACPDFIDSCSFLKISGIKKLCNYNDSYTYKILRNKKCALVPQWRLPAGVIIVGQTDSSISIKFPAQGSYRIAASMNSCIPVKDSLLVIVAPPGGVLNIGADTSLCPGSSITLRAANNFFSYRWNNNSTDSLLQVTAPGIYWVETIDSCNNIQRDSITISPYNSTINIGPDRVSCANDTLHLVAPGGFLTYQWSNNYNINSTTTQTVIVSPAIDTAYYLKAEILPGCFAFDTVRIKVNVAPPIMLGADKSFCRGDSLLLDAGSGYALYLWNNGAALQQLTIFNAGSYSVTATTPQGCKASDTLVVLNVWNQPMPNLDKTPGLCLNTNRVLNAGNYSTYLWQDGSTAPAFTATAPGTYFVSVKDENQCIGFDTTRILYSLPLPADFLPADTAICRYDEITIRPAQNYRNYLWSNGSTNALLLIKEPGIYTLTVTDANNCKGTDQLTVGPKECMEGIYVPSAFTPNKDGNNDVFRPLLFGNLQYFEFNIFNRYGQRIFTSTDAGQGWDGTAKGMLQETGAYTWICRFAINNKPVELRKGQVLLIR